MFFQHLFYLKCVYCNLPLPLVYGLYAWENVDKNSERPLTNSYDVIIMTLMESFLEIYVS